MRSAAPALHDAPAWPDLDAPHDDVQALRGPGPALDPPLLVRMLAGFRLWHDGAPVTTLPQGRSRTLLKLMLLRRHRPLGRMQLCGLFFADQEPAQARTNLHATVHRLRRAVAGVLDVRHDSEGYQLVARGPVWLDVEQFVLHADLGSAADAQGCVEQALEHYDLAAELYASDLSEDPRHDDVLAADNQAARARLNQVLERAAVLREQAGDLHGCLRAGHRHLALDDCNEEAHRRLIRCYGQLGQIQLAERQYLGCVSALRRRLGLQPSEATTQAYRRLCERRPL